MSLNQSRPTSRPKWLIRICLAALGCAAGLVVSEFQLRAAILRSAAALYPGMYAADPSTGYRLRGNFRGTMRADQQRFPVATDENGWRIDPSDVLPKAGAKVAVVGDSFVFGHLVAYRDSLPAQLQSALQALGTPTQAKNFGVPGFCPVEYAAWVVAQAAAWKPDALVLAVYVGNDFREIAEHEHVQVTVLNGYLQSSASEELADLGPFSRWIFQRSVLCRRLLRGLWLEPSNVATTKTGICALLARDSGVAADTYLVHPPADILAAYAQAEILLAQCFQSARAAGIQRLVLLSLPAPVEYDPRQFQLAQSLCDLKAGDYDLQRPQRFLQAVAQRHGVPFFAGAEPLQQYAQRLGADGLYTDAHLSPLGTSVVVGSLAQFLQASLQQSAPTDR